MYSLLLVALLGLNVDSRIDGVVVYIDQAQVVRKATVSITGSEQLVFEGLTGMLDDNSIRVKAAGLHIGEVKVKPGYLAQPTGRVKLLEDSLDGLNRLDRSYSDEQDVLKARDAFLGSIKLGAPEIMSKELTAGRVDAGSWGAALGFLATELTAVKKRAAELERTRKELAKTIAAVKQELDNTRAKWENRKTLTVDAVSDQGGSHEVTISYLVPYSVSWSPYYELRAAPSDGKVGLTYYANLSQRTNEDWSNVKVVLSTARPSAGGVAPEPMAWYLDIWEPTFSGKSAGRMAPAPGAAVVTGSFDAEYGEAAEEKPAPSIETGISLQYVIPGTVNLKSGEDPKKLFLYDAKLPAEFSFYSYPRTQELAYLRGKLQNNTDYIFLAGQGNTYVGDEFTGRTYLSTIAPGESAAISFGVDDRVKVKRELVKSLTGKAGLLGNRTKVEFLYRTTVQNYHSQSINLTLIEQVPVTQNKDIKVDVSRLEPKPAEENKDLGTFTFRSELKPQEKVLYNLGYSVEYPTGKRISGLY